MEAGMEAAGRSQQPFASSERHASNIPIHSLSGSWLRLGHGFGKGRARALRQRDIPDPEQPESDSAAHLPHHFSNRADRKSTRLNSSHVKISYAVFCLKKKIKTELHK